MSYITVWKSDTDGKLFESKQKYIEHLKKIARIRRNNKLVEHHTRTRDQFLATLAQVGSILELADFIKSNWSWFSLNGSVSRLHANSEYQLHTLLELDITNVNYSDCIRNTHSCPRSGVTNFCQNSPEGKDLPKYYPGWQGRIKFKLQIEHSKNRKGYSIPSGWGSDYFRNTLLHIGGGGLVTVQDDTVDYCYDITLWADDFVKMRQRHAQQVMWNHLGGDTPLVASPYISDKYR